MRSSIAQPSFLALLVLLSMNVRVTTAGQWVSEFHQPGLNGPVSALGTFEGSLLVGGGFTHIGSERFGSIARWEAGQWSPLGEGLSVAPAEIQEFLGDVYVATGQGIHWEGAYYPLMKWDGSTWVPVGEGTTSGSPSRVNAMEVFQGRLVVAGRFERIGEEATPHIAAFDGAVWSGLSTGMTTVDTPIPITEVEALAILGGELVAGGRFNRAGGAVADNVARWDGMNWRPIPDADDVEFVDALMAHDGDLWVHTAYKLYRWDGATWGQVAGGPGNSIGPMAAASGELFMVAGGRLLTWTGVLWQMVNEAPPDDTIYALHTFDDKLYIGGTFEPSPTASVRRFARWSGSTWEPLDATGGGWISDDPSHMVLALCRFQGDLVAGGWFPSAGDHEVNNIARWDGTAWSPLDLGMNGAITSLTVYGGDLVAGGYFLLAGGEAASRVAAWDGVDWRPLGPGIQGQTSTVFALEVLGSSLYVAGSFDEAGGTSAHSIARWDGSAWYALGSGANNDVTALAVLDGELIAGGWFSQIGSAAGPVARWTGTEWLRVGNGLSLNIEALHVEDGVLYAAGVGNLVYRLNGSDWEPVSALTSQPGLPVARVEVLGSFQGDLVAGGWFQDCIARLEGDIWTPFDGGLNERPLALLSEGDHLYAGGMFTVAGSVPSLKMAHWDESLVPVRLLSLTAQWAGKTAEVRWEIAEANSASRFGVYRGATPATRVQVGSYLPADRLIYVVEDPAAPIEGCQYWLEERERTGASTWHGPALLPVMGPMPRFPRLTQNQPNPFSHETLITFTLLEPAPVRVEIFDLAGRKVATAFEGMAAAGATRIRFDAGDVRGSRLSPGIYMLRMSHPKGVCSRKMLFLPK